jgi:hypothetical protein
MSRHTEASEELFTDFVATLFKLAQIDGYTIRERH